MIIKQKMIEEIIAKIQKRLTEIKSMLDATPIQVICDYRKELHAVCIDETKTFKEKHKLFLDMLTKTLLIKETNDLVFNKKEKLIHLCNEEVTLKLEQEKLLNIE